MSTLTILEQRLKQLEDRYAGRRNQAIYRESNDLLQQEINRLKQQIGNHKRRADQK